LLLLLCCSYSKIKRRPAKIRLPTNLAEERLLISNLPPRPPLPKEHQITPRSTVSEVVEEEEEEEEHRRP